MVYSLALAVYCSSWTFYGAVGTAARYGLAYLPIYLGPMLLFVFGFGLLRRLVQVVRQRNITSIADFIGARFGKSHGLAALVAVIAVIAMVPYIALQFKAVAMSFGVLGGARHLAGRSRRHRQRAVVCRCCWPFSRSSSVRAASMPPNITTA